MNRCAVFAAGLALAGSPAVAQVDRVTCGSNLEGLDNVELQLLFDAGIYDPPVAPLGGVWEVPITFHVVRRSNGTGGANQGQIDQALTDLNDAFAPAGMAFCQMGPTQYIDSDAFYFDIDSDQEIIDLKKTNHVPGTINVYTTENLANDDFELCGDSSFTWFGTQGIVMWNGCFGDPGNLRFAHEVGHYFNLFHTHEVACCYCVQGSCSECTDGSNCACCGDRICDTPADPLLYDLDNFVFLVENCVYTGDAVPPCQNDPPYDPDVSNIMAYAPIECVEAFTPQQNTRMLGTLIHKRYELIQTDCAWSGDCGAGAGPCPEPHGGSGCLDAACCTIVCDDDPSCCDTSWDLACALLAQDICDLGPPNDDCADAQIAYGAQFVHFDTTYADTDGPEHPECDFDDDQVNSDVWYHYQAPCTGDLTLSTCADADFDTRLAAYGNLNCPVSFIDLLGCNDDGPGCAGGTSELTLYVILGDLLKVRVGGAGFEQGTGTLHFDCKTQFDDCDAPLSLFGYEGPVNINTIGAEQDGPSFCGTHNDVWIEYHPSCTGFLQIDKQADFAMGIAAYDNCGCPATMDDQVYCGGNGFFVEANQCYKVQVGGFGHDEEGTGQVTFTCLPSPDNDHCENATEIGPGDTVNFDTESAGTDGPAHLARCAGGNPLDSQIWFDIWYEFTAPCDATLTASTCGQADFDTRVAIYDGCACPVTDDDLLVCSDDAGGCGLTSEATADVVEGQCYLIRVGGASAQHGTGQLSIELEPECQGDANGDWVIDVADFLIILSTWGACPPPCPPSSCPADFDGDCTVGVTDFLIMLANWT